MTGPEHYLEAERLLTHLGEQVDEITASDLAALDNTAVTTSLVALIRGAQVHATLALAAATAESPQEGSFHPRWDQIGL